MPAATPAPALHRAAEHRGGSARDDLAARARLRRPRARSCPATLARSTAPAPSADPAATGAGAAAAAFAASSRTGRMGEVQGIARKAAVGTLVVIGIVALALALWKLRVLISLFSLGLVIAAAMRPGIESLNRRRIPRSVGLALHYLAVAGLVALFLWLVVPRAVTQVGDALGTVPTSRSELNQAAKHSTGIKHTILVSVQKRLKRLPTAGAVFHASVNVTKAAFEVLLGIFAGIVKIIPVIGPLAAGAVAIGVGLTDSWQVALGAGLAVLGVRLFEDYIVVPRVLGHAVGLSPLVVLVSVTAIGLLLGGVYILLAVPIAAVLVTLVDVIVRDKDPAKEEVPTVLFPAKDAEA